MWRIQIKALLLSAVLLLTASAQQPGDIIIGDILVMLKPGEQAAALTSDFANVSLFVSQPISERMNVWLMKYDPVKASPDEMLENIKKHPSVKIAQFNHIIQLRDDSGEQQNRTNSGDSLIFPNDPSFNNQWALHNTGQSGGVPDADIDAVEAWYYSTGGLTADNDTIVVAIIDGGFDLNHNDLNFYKNELEIPNNGIDDDNNGYVDDYDGWNAYNNNGTITSSSHGTHVAGIVGAKGNNGIGVSGVNWNCKLMAIQGSSTVESTVLIAYGYAHAMRSLYNETNGLKGAFVVATNSSFGVDYGQPSNYPLWCAFFDSLGTQGILSCAATANINLNVDVQGDVPTGCSSDWLVSVTNTTNSDNKNSGAAYGLTTIDLGAPGTSIYNTIPGNSYANKTGTSMATPTVAGVIALMFSAASPELITSYKNAPGATALLFKQYLLEAVDSISALQNITVTGGRLNAYNALISVSVSPDTVAPTVITDLSAVNILSNGLTLTWTTPLDTTRNGVTGYEIRQSTTPITDLQSFLAAAEIPYTGTPDTAGGTESFTISGLQAAASYYYAVRAYDMFGNYSDISNVLQQTTLDPPQMKALPDSLFQPLPFFATATDTLLIENISPDLSTLDFTISLVNHNFPGNLVHNTLLPTNSVDRLQPVEKEKLYTVDYGMSIEGSGGPDAFGYEWIDSDEENGAVYEWNSISSSGTLVTNWQPTGIYNAKDEGYAGPFSLGFGFPFYGITHNDIYISSNGLVLFTAPAANTMTNYSIPSSQFPDNLIAPFWDDLEGQTSGNVYVKQETDKYIVQFDNWNKYSGVGSLTFQIVLHSSGRIEYFYKNMDGILDEATVGIENDNGTIGLQIANNALYVKDSLAVLIAAEPDWLHTNTISGRIYNGSSAALVFTFQSDNFDPGYYSYDMIVETNDPSVPADTVRVSMIIYGMVPVELSSFAAETDRDNVLLSWKTATESNNRGFEIQRQTAKIQWETISFIDGAGTSTEPVSYSFSDTNLKPGTYFYRLRQLDFDNTESLSETIEVSVGLPGQYELLQNYPNPFNPSTVIEFALPEDIEVNLNVYNALGEKTAVLQNGLLGAGYHKYTFNGADFPSGIYIYQLNAGSFSQSRKMLLIK